MKQGIMRDRVLSAVLQDPDATVTELSEKVGIARSAIHHHLKSLEAEGLIRMHHERGNRRGHYTSHLSAEELSVIRSKAAKQRKKNKTVSGKELQDRIDMVVAKAKAREAQGNDEQAPGANDAVRYIRPSHMRLRRLRARKF